MLITSLGYQTDIFFTSFDGIVIDRDDYVVVRSPLNPTHYWGNYLLFPKPPGPDDFTHWLRLFESEIGNKPDISHIAIGWDSINRDVGYVQRFIDAGFTLDSSVVLTACSVHKAPKHNDRVEVRPVLEAWEWAQSVENHVAARDPIHAEDAFRIYRQRGAERYRAMIRAGLGVWFGAFIGDQLIGDLGVFINKATSVVRFQGVSTHSEFRRIGICGRLVYDASIYALSELGATKLVMVADPDYHAAKIYESVGFQRSEYQVGVSKHPG